MPPLSTDIQAFGRPSVKDGVLSQPVHGSDGSRALKAPASQWREMAWNILYVTEAKGRPVPPLGRNPILKPHGRIL